jgi:hypothetical protein
LKRAVDKSSLRASLMGRRSALDQSFPWRIRRSAGKLKRHIVDAYAEARFGPRPGSTEVRTG